MPFSMSHSSKRPLKSNDDRKNTKIILPIAPIDKTMRSELKIYARFMRHLRLVPNSRVEIKILSAIQFTADMLDTSDALVAKTLVDLGLRATRQSFPAAYLEFSDKSMLRKKWDLGAPSESLASLHEHWDNIGEDKFAAFQNEVKVVQDTVYI